MKALFKYILVLTLLLTLSLEKLSAQNAGVRPMDISAIKYLFQPVQAWKGGKYSEAKPLIAQRFYFNASSGIAQNWSYYQDLNSSNWQLTNKLNAGYKLAPVHALEMGLGINSDLTNLEHHLTAGISYLFNLSTYASRSEQSKRLEVSFIAGVETEYFPSTVVNVNAGARLKYNISPSVGIFLEPRISSVVYSNSNSYAMGDIGTSLSFGVSLNPHRIKENISSAITKRREWWESVGYVHQPIMAVKTNLLFDAATLINVELEVPIKKRISIAAEWTFPWWTFDDGTIDSERSRIQLLNASLEVKYWLGNRDDKAVMTGWFVSIFSQGGLYDFEINAKGYQGEFYVAMGAGGGYAHAINKRGNLRMEYALGLGYLQTDYRFYEAFYDTTLLKWRPVLMAEGRYSLFTPLKAKVSLCWLMTRKKRIK